MKVKMVLDKIDATQHGAMRSMVWERPLKTKKSAGNNYVVKRTHASGIRFGISYDNMASTKEGRENGTKPIANAGLIGRTWIRPNVLLKSEKSGNTLVRCSMGKSSTFDTEYFLNGRKVDKEVIAPFVLKSEITSHGERPEVMDVNTDYIIAID